MSRLRTVACVMLASVMLMACGAIEGMMDAEDIKAVTSEYSEYYNTAVNLVRSASSRQMKDSTKSRIDALQQAIENYDAAYDTAKNTEAGDEGMENFWGGVPFLNNWLAPRSAAINSFRDAGENLKHKLEDAQKALDEDETYNQQQEGDIVGQAQSFFENMDLTMILIIAGVVLVVLLLILFLFAKKRSGRPRKMAMPAPAVAAPVAAAPVAASPSQLQYRFEDSYNQRVKQLGVDPTLSQEMLSYYNGSYKNAYENVLIQSGSAADVATRFNNIKNPKKVDYGNPLAEAEAKYK